MTSTSRMSAAHDVYCGLCQRKVGRSSIDLKVVRCLKPDCVARARAWKKSGRAAK